MNDELAQKLKYLRLGGLLANWDRYLATARKGNYSHTRLLQYVVAEEYQIKKENSRKMRLNRAKIPEKWAIETFPFERQPKLNKKKIVGIYDAFDSLTAALVDRLTENSLVLNMKNCVSLRPKFDPAG